MGARSRLELTPLDRLQAAWLLKVRALTEQSYVDELEVEDEGIAELLLDDNAIADVARAYIPPEEGDNMITSPSFSGPGTSLKKPSTAAGIRATSQGIRYGNHCISHSLLRFAPPIDHSLNLAGQCPASSDRGHRKVLLVL